MMAIALNIDPNEPVDEEVFVEEAQVKPTEPKQAEEL